MKFVRPFLLLAAVAMMAGLAPFSAAQTVDTTPPTLDRGEVDGGTMTLYFSEALDAEGRDPLVTGPERGMAVKDGEGEAAAPSAVAAAGLRAGKPLREIAVDLYGREQVDADWHADRAMRSKLRRLVRLVRRARDKVPAPGEGTGPRRSGVR